LRGKNIQWNGSTSVVSADGKLERFVTVLQVIKYASMCTEENKRLGRENRRLRELLIEGLELMGDMEEEIFYNNNLSMD
jgi:hypothetical protein